MGIFKGDEAISNIFTTWSPVGEHEMPDHKQGSGWRLFQLEKTWYGSSNTSDLKAPRAMTKQNQEKGISSQREFI